MNTILVTGGAGFIGSNFILGLIAQGDGAVINLDKLTYAGNLGNLESIQNNPRHIFVKGDIGDRELVRRLLTKHQPRAVVHLAAETHVDRSIIGPADFMATNVTGTFHLLEETSAYWNSLPMELKNNFRFLHVSTDEVYGSLETDEPPFSELAPYVPNSPYAASKAAADHLVRAYHRTYGLPAVITNCSNNYGPYQFPEKLIPLIVVNALSGKPLPVYGDGQHVRDWLHVEDHCAALTSVLMHGRIGEKYNIGASNEKTNLDVVQSVCAALDELRPDPTRVPHASRIKFVEDRPGHDRRYAIDATKIHKDIGWRAQHSFASGIHETVRWYLAHSDWIRHIESGEYLAWIDKNYGGRQAI